MLKAMCAGVPLAAGLTSANAPPPMHAVSRIASAPAEAPQPVMPMAPAAEGPAATAVIAAQPLIPTAGDGVSLGRALDCLTAAIYYEAANEETAGQRAVAQVVLNRVRHVAYPNSVCGVVFEGAHLPTGCQFTFTCDGSLARTPSRQGWRRARELATAALAGYVAEDVGLATHYHASYVSPRWAPRLVHQKTIGLHVFYRMPGQTGAPGAYRNAYTGRETISTDAKMAEARTVAAAAAEPLALAAAEGDVPLAPAMAPMEEKATPVRSARLRPLRLAARPSLEAPIAGASEQKATLAGATALTRDEDGAS